MPDVKSRICTNCGERKPLIHFGRNKVGKYGRQAQCKECMKRYYQASKGRYRQRNLLNYYGITLEAYDKMLEDQGGGCAICGQTPEENGQRLEVDHNHETGEVRGLLCRTCNMGVGAFKDSVERCLQAAEYLK